MSDLEFCLEEIKEVFGENYIKVISKIEDDLLKEIENNKNVETKTLLRRAFDCVIFLEKLCRVLG